MSYDHSIQINGSSVQSQDNLRLGAPPPYNNDVAPLHYDIESPPPPHFEESRNTVTRAITRAGSPPPNNAIRNALFHLQKPPIGERFKAGLGAFALFCGAKAAAAGVAVLKPVIGVASGAAFFYDNSFELYERMLEPSKRLGMQMNNIMENCISTAMAEKSYYNENVYSMEFNLVEENATPSNSSTPYCLSLDLRFPVFEAHKMFRNITVKNNSSTTLKHEVSDEAKFRINIIPANQANNRARDNVVDEYGIEADVIDNNQKQYTISINLRLPVFALDKINGEIIVERTIDNKKFRIDLIKAKRNFTHDRQSSNHESSKKLVGISKKVDELIEKIGTPFAIAGGTLGAGAVAGAGICLGAAAAGVGIFTAPIWGSVLFYVLCNALKR